MDGQIVPIAKPVTSVVPARPFDPFRRAKSAAAETIVESVLHVVSRYEDKHGLRKRKRKAVDQATYETTIEAIVCDLLYRHLEVPSGQLHVSQSNQILRKKSRYKGQALGKTLPDLLKVLAIPEVGVVEITPGSKTFKGTDYNPLLAGAGRQTILTAGPSLLALQEHFGVTFTGFGRSDDEEILLLRGTKQRDDKPAPLVEYDDTEETNALRQEMQTLNAWLETVPLSCTDPQINTTDRRLRRIFNNKDFAQGGRLFGGFWQGMKHDARLEAILLNDDTLVELDYGQAGLLLLYGLIGATPPTGDLYDLTEYGFAQECRPGIKKVIQASINASKPLIRMPKGVRKTIPASKSFSATLAAIGQRHPAIVHLFGTRVGLQLMRTEADILVAVLLELKSRGIFALPIHDAILVEPRYEQEATEVMKAVFKERIGLIPEVSVESS
ncbi:hypothetical protein AB9F26_21965 [Falsihalocynthiibacter sp. BN13B15]|uniref:hypothetical protein n=1 Tax=Falsihalocynthiibacter sp. BN13B15 TaxID=3240871 RepID=UPI00350FA6DD